MQKCVLESVNMAKFSSPPAGPLAAGLEILSMSARSAAPFSEFHPEWRGSLTPASVDRLSSARSSTFGTKRL